MLLSDICLLLNVIVYSYSSPAFPFRATLQVARKPFSGLVATCKPSSYLGFCNTPVPD